MDYRREYAQWREWVTDEKVKLELNSIEADDEAIKSRFATEMSFGTAGLRSRMGAGPGRNERLHRGPCDTGPGGVCEGARRGKCGHGDRV